MQAANGPLSRDRLRPRSPGRAASGCRSMLPAPPKRPRAPRARPKRRAPCVRPLSLSCLFAASPPCVPPGPPTRAFRDGKPHMLAAPRSLRASLCPQPPRRSAPACLPAPKAGTVDCQGGLHKAGQGARGVTDRRRRRQLRRPCRCCHCRCAGPLFPARTSLPFAAAPPVPIQARLAAAVRLHSL
jgi:hypothetical protein